MDRRRAMAVEARPELVGKRFLCVAGDEPPEIGDIGRWPWRSGVIRAVNHLDSDNPDLTVRRTRTFVLTNLLPRSVTCKSNGKCVRSVGSQRGGVRRTLLCGFLSLIAAGWTPAIWRCFAKAFVIVVHV